MASKARNITAICLLSTSNQNVSITRCLILYLLSINYGAESLMILEDFLKEIGQVINPHACLLLTV